MGTADALVEINFLHDLLHNWELSILRMVLFDYSGNYLIRFKSDQLPDGYHGMMDIYIDNNELKFKKDIDV